MIAAPDRLLALIYSPDHRLLRQHKRPHLAECRGDPKSLCGAQYLFGKSGRLSGNCHTPECFAALRGSTLTLALDDAPSTLGSTASNSASARDFIRSHATMIVYYG